MLEFYPQIKLVHVFCVVLSGCLFALRGTMQLVGLRLSGHPVLRFSSYVIDTTLLTAALMLITILHQYPFVQLWLTVKVLLIIFYIVLGIFTFHYCRSRVIRSICFLAALATYVLIVGIAHTHDPMSWFALLYS